MGGLETIVKPSHWDDQGYWKEWVWRICSWSSPTGIQVRTWGSCDIPVSCISAFSVWTVSWKTWDGTEFVRKQIWDAQRFKDHLGFPTRIPTCRFSNCHWFWTYPTCHGARWGEPIGHGALQAGNLERVEAEESIFGSPQPHLWNIFYGYIANGYKLVIPNTLIILNYFIPTQFFKDHVY